MEVCWPLYSMEGVRQAHGRRCISTSLRAPSTAHRGFRRMSSPASGPTSGASCAYRAAPPLRSAACRTTSIFSCGGSWTRASRRWPGTSRQDRLGGCTRPSRNSGSLRGSQDTVCSRCVTPALGTSARTSGTRPNTIRHALTRRSFSRFCGLTRSSSTKKRSSRRMALACPSGAEDEGGRSQGFRSPEDGLAPPLATVSRPAGRRGYCPPRGGERRYALYAAATFASASPATRKCSSLRSWCIGSAITVWESCSATGSSSLGANAANAGCRVSGLG